MSKSKKTNQSTKQTITRKDLILTFVTFFLIFGFVGYLRGRSIRNQPERLRWDVLARLELGERKGEKIIAYQCNGRRQVSWDIDADVLFTERVARPGDEYAFVPAVFKNDSLITAFLTGGGVASVFTAKEILSFAGSSTTNSRLLNESRIKLILVALAAAVSGYEVGYQIALHTNSDCADPRFSSILNDAKNWKGDGKDWEGLEKVFWILSVEALERETPSGYCKSPDESVRTVEDQQFAKGRAEFMEFRQGDVTSLEHNITSTDFDPVTRYRDIVRAYNKRCGT